jgi:parallel beta-helix repeat protein
MQLNLIGLGERKLLKKTFSVLMLTLLLTGMWALAFNIHPAKTGETIYAGDDESSISMEAVLEVDRTIGNRYVKYWEHVINGVIFVKNDFILMHTDVESGEILRYQKKWREVKLKNVESKPFEPRKEYLWKKLVVFLGREDCGYFYTFDDIHEYPLVCWEVRHVNGTTIMYDLDGIKVGFGISAPISGFSLSGYHNTSWPDPWIDFRKNADSWFKVWCNTTASISLPTPSTISYYVSDLDYEYFYELAHGSSYYFQADSIGSYYYSSNVATDMFLRPPMRFAFIGSCDGMKDTGSGTFSYEFRKGHLINTTTVGYTGMASCPGWSVALQWQNYMFQKINEGYTIEASFDLASAEYPTIAPCVKFVGDANLKAERERPIYIRADGSVDPPDAPISTLDNITYTLTGNITSSADGIVVQRSNIIIDGAGYTLQGPERISPFFPEEISVGFNLSCINGVTIKNTNINGSDLGIYLYNSSKNTLFKNEITGNTYSNGILVEYLSFNNRLDSNNVRKHRLGIAFWASFNNTLRNNHMIENHFHFSVYGEELSHFIHDIDSSNTINYKPVYYWVNHQNEAIPSDAAYVALVNSRNIVVSGLELKNNLQAIMLVNTTNAQIANNNIKDCDSGIDALWSPGNSFLDNNITKNFVGFRLYSSSDNSFSRNSIINTSYGFHVMSSFGNSFYENNIRNCGLGVDLDMSSWNIISDNLIADCGRGLELHYSSYNNLCNNNINGNPLSSFSVGVMLDLSSDNNILFSNNITNNFCGVVIYDTSSNNTVFENTITNNEIGLIVGLSGNKIYHNDFINTKQVEVEVGCVTVWDDGYPSGGNYWSDYMGKDLFRGSDQNEIGSDGIGDTSYIIDTNNIDRYPFTKPYGGPHDVGIAEIKTSKTIIGQGYNLSISVKIINYGVNTEAFNLTIYANTSIISSLNDMVLTSRNSTTITFTWDTTGFAKGNFTIKAYATPVLGETDTSDNEKIVIVLVTKKGDVNGDDEVNVLDLILVSVHLGHINGNDHVPFSNEWYQCMNTDLNNDNDHNVLDLILVAICLGT